MNKYRVALSVALLVLLGGSALAQAPGDPDNAVQVGDQWTYVTKDEITGAIGNRRTATVTEVTPKEIVTTMVEQSGSHLIVFDHEEPDEEWGFRVQTSRCERRSIPARGRKRVAPAIFHEQYEDGCHLQGA